jgi:hypothetical protein
VKIRTNNSSHPVRSLSGHGSTKQLAAESSYAGNRAQRRAERARVRKRRAIKAAARRVQG